MKTNAALRSIIYYAICSSVMLVINKVAISFVPLPGLVFCVQFSTTFLFILVGKHLGWLRVDSLTAAKALQFSPYVASFVLSIYFNGKVLQYCNVETLITFRACSPLCVSLLDWMFLGRELPSTRSFFALLGVLSGAIGYVLSDSEFQLHGVSAYGWVSVYLVVIIFEMTYAKHMISNVKFESAVWGSVLYTNALAILPMLLLAVMSGELDRVRNVSLNVRSFLTLATCCFLGIGMNWSGWNCREQISAASYTLLGVACKMISVLLNVLIWDKHATPAGICWLIVCLIASTFYRQSPLRIV
eukprot:TRINITY_DN26315_c0_g1_i1.p1 TRINITY_DN26315_c0_g1~~TRINITY_DN26315_c0_g1_i1.p1  ORF type:complete len:329 (+),score=45.27 TRINITY_DN26315_c0_g1_i1:87-989(+)